MRTLHYDHLYVAVMLDLPHTTVLGRYFMCRTTRPFKLIDWL